MDKYKQDFSNPQLTQQLNADMQEGQKIGVRGTPTVFPDRIAESIIIVVSTSAGI